jgi:hypothetical protein
LALRCVRYFLLSTTSRLVAINGVGVMKASNDLFNIVKVTNFVTNRKEKEKKTSSGQFPKLVITIVMYGGQETPVSLLNRV